MMAVFKKDFMPNFYNSAVDANSKLFTRREELKLLRSAKRGNMDSQNRLLMVNQRLIMRIARRIAGGYKFRELIQEGNIGYIIAIKKFNSKKYKCRLSTYAGWWVMHYMIRFFENTEEEIRIPVCSHYIRKSLKKKEKNGILLSEKDKKNMAIQSQRGQVVASLDIFDYGERNDLHEKMKGNDAFPGIEDSIDLEKLMAPLSAKEKQIVMAHYVEEKTLRDIAKEMMCSRQTVLNWETRAMKKIHDALEKRRAE